MNLRRFDILAAVATCLLLSGVPLKGEAVTRITGTFSLEDSYASSLTGSTNLLEGGLTFDIMPQTKKNLRSRFTIPLRFSISDEEKNAEVSPNGNFALDLGGEWYTMNLQYGRFATIGSNAEVTDTSTSRAALVVQPPLLPRLFVSYTDTETTTGQVTTSTETISAQSDYRYRWMNFRGGYSVSERTSGAATPSTSSAFSLGMGGNYEIFSRTTVSGDYDFNRSVTELSSGGESSTVSNALRLAIDSRPLQWMGVGGIFTRNTTDYDRESTTQQYVEGTMTLYPFQPLRLTASLGNRTFDDVAQERSVTFSTIGASYTDRMLEKILLGVNLFRSYEWDPDQGDNIRDTFGLNATMDLTSRITLRANFSVNRNENTSFVTNKQYDISGSLVERDALDLDRGGLPAGFIFYDVINSDLYTKNSSTVGDWSLPTRFEPMTEQFFVSRNLQMNIIPSDKTSVAVSYSSSTSSEQLNLGKIGNQSLNGSLIYRANRRTNFSFAGTAAIPETGINSYSGTAGVSYRFLRGHQLNANYGAQSSGGNRTDTFSSTLSFALRKRTSLEFSYSTLQPFKDDQTYTVRIRFNKSF